MTTTTPIFIVINDYHGGASEWLRLDAIEHVGPSEEGDDFVCVTTNRGEPYDVDRRVWLQTLRTLGEWPPAPKKADR